MNKIQVRYFAILKDERGLSEEELQSANRSLGDLYAELKEKHGFSLDTSNLKVAVNDEFCDWSREIASGDQIVFIPPVAGG